jgi:hypothetical protein
VQRLAPLDQLVDGTYAATNTSAWCGSATDNCSSWTSNSNVAFGTDVPVDQLYNVSTTNLTCNKAASLFCLED